MALNGLEESEPTVLKFDNQMKQISDLPFWR